MGVMPWDSSLNIKDEVTGCSAMDFANKYRAQTGEEDVTYHTASAASVVSIMVQAMEQADTTNETELAQLIAQSSFKTMYGDVSFDTNGQSIAPSLLIQYDTNNTVHTIFPSETSSGPILYPMPTWDQRDCINLSACEELGDTCNDYGECVCSDPDSYYAAGSGINARCIPKEKMNYIDGVMVMVGHLIVALVLAVALVTFAWTYYYRNNTLVKASQPFFLGMVITGTLLSSLSIVPMSAETGYRDSEDIRKVDAACMAAPWLWGLGFSITFSALFAKVWRVKKLYKASLAMRRRGIKEKDVLSIMVCVVAVEVAIILSFQLVSPHRWEREVIDEVYGYSVDSFGHCTSDNGWWFFSALVGFNIICLLHALILCFQTKGIPSDFSESSHIFLSVMLMFQVLVLVIPVFAMVRKQPTVFYFVRAAAVFLQNFTVLVIIFWPKMLRLYKGEDTLNTVRQTVRNSVRCMRQGSRSPIISGLESVDESVDYSQPDKSSVSLVGSRPELSPGDKTLMSNETCEEVTDSPCQSHEFKGKGLAGDKSPEDKPAQEGDKSHIQTPDIEAGSRQTPWRKVTRISMTGQFENGGCII
jgi:hypothetical protein